MREAQGPGQGLRVEGPRVGVAFGQSGERRGGEPRAGSRRRSGARRSADAGGPAGATRQCRSSADAPADGDDRLERVQYRYQLYTAPSVRRMEPASPRGPDRPV